MSFNILLCFCPCMTIYRWLLYSCPSGGRAGTHFHLHILCICSSCDCEDTHYHWHKSKHTFFSFPYSQCELSRPSEPSVCAACEGWWWVSWWARFDGCVRGLRGRDWIRHDVGRRGWRGGQGWNVRDGSRFFGFDFDFLGLVVYLTYQESIDIDKYFVSRIEMTSIAFRSFRALSTTAWESTVFLISASTLSISKIDHCFCRNMSVLIFFVSLMRVDGS